MGRRKVNFESVVARFPEGTLRWIDGVLREGESRAQFLREAVERELERRERGEDSQGPMGPVGDGTGSRGPKSRS
jgi:hypothetical protein